MSCWISSLVIPIMVVTLVVADTRGLVYPIDRVLLGSNVVLGVNPAHEMFTGSSNTLSVSIAGTLYHPSKDNVDNDIRSQDHFSIGSPSTCPTNNTSQFPAEWTFGPLSNPGTYLATWEITQFSCDSSATSKSAPTHKRFVVARTFTVGEEPPLTHQVTVDSNKQTTHHAQNLGDEEQEMSTAPRPPGPQVEFDVFPSRGISPTELIKLTFIVLSLAALHIFVAMRRTAESPRER